MSTVPEPSEQRVVEILEEYMAAVEAGNAPDEEELLSRHPDLKGSLSSALRGLEFVRRGARALDARDGDPGPGAAGQVLGDYRLLREVGRGGMAVVYEAEQISLGRRVALKVLPFAAVLDPKQLQRFKNEALAAAHLDHPHIVPVHAVGCERGVHYYAMRFVDGQSLAAAIQSLKGGGAGEGPRTPISSHGSNREIAYIRMAVALGVQAAEALDHAHQLGIVHRDVKPANLLVDHAGTLRVADFGLARSLNDAGLTVTGELLGTVRYMSPEQAMAKRVPVDHRTDIYSLGATLYELFTLEPAFPGDDPHLVLQDIAFRDPVPSRKLNPAIPVDLETVLLKAMSKDPMGRYATAQEMADDLIRFLEDKPVLAQRPSVAARVAKWRRRHRGLVAASVVVLLVAVATLAVGGVRLAREEANSRAALREARENLHLARGAVNEFLVQIGLYGLKDDRLATPAKRALLQRALDFYGRFEADPGDAAAHMVRGYILVNLERREEAVAAFDRALSADATGRSLGPAFLCVVLCGRGRSLGELKRYDEALATLDRAIRLDPTSATAHAEQGVALDYQGRHEEALAAHDRAVALDATMIEAQANRGVTLRKLGRYEEALAADDRAVALDPLRAGVHHERGLALGKLGRREEGLEAIEHAIALEPDHAWAHYDRGIALRELGRHAEALVAYDRSIEIDPNRATVHVGRAGALCALGRRDEALAASDRAIAIDPSCAEAHAMRGWVLWKLGRRDEALRACERALGLKPEDARTEYNRGGILQELGRTEDALEAWERAIELDPGQADAHANRACALHVLGRDQDALAAIDRAIELAPKDANHHRNRGGFLCALERYGEALAACDRAVALDPNDAVGPYLRGVCLYHLNRYMEALAAHDRALKLDPGMGLAHASRGEILDLLGRPAEALAALDRAIDLGGSQDLSLLNEVAWRRATAPDPESRNTARAIELAREAVKRGPGDGCFWNTLGVALYRAEAWQEALDALGKSMELRSGGDPCDWFFVAMAHARLGHADEAARWHQKGVAWMEGMGKDDPELRRFRDEAAAALATR